MRALYKQLLSWYHLLFAWGAAWWYGHPSRRLVVVGVTGTKGKSTVLAILRAMLAAHLARPALLSSVHRIIADETNPNPYGNSMPGRGRIQKFLRAALDAGATHALIEVTSEGCVQHRHRFIDWDAALYTNLSAEHIESHGSFEAYRAAKLLLFQSLASSVKRPRYFAVNIDDANAQCFIDAAEAVRDHRIVRFKTCALSQAVKGAALANPKLATLFNLENVAASWAIAETLGVTSEEALTALHVFEGVPGRFEEVQAKPFRVIVDYAHTPDSLAAIYAAVRATLASGARLIGVFGAAAGGRDSWKRPVMGKLAAEWCDAIILTTEDPFDESPDRIADEIARGFQDASPRRLREDQIFRIMDRRMAIRKAFRLAKPGDAVVLTGKGSETSIRVANGETIPWREREVAEEELVAMRGAN
jgi:UDP-N-acetylmuramoyl-L-alanyl-D-glutamate--2,6-diaminopimelate ligase